jgi:membrane peptidoglycan carboxypeptidase
LRRISRILVLGLLLAVFCVLAYQAYAVANARQVTVGVFEREIKKATIKIKFDDLSQQQIEQLIAVEDPNFYRHNGFDLSTPGAGLTTITQAMVKYLYFNNFRPGFQKIEQTLIAWLVVDKMVNKNDQLVVFVNTAYFGENGEEEIRGFSAAAEVYFKKEFKALSGDEYLSLVAMLIAPNDFSITKNPKKNRDRLERIKRLVAGNCKPKDNRDVYYEQCS